KRLSALSVFLTSCFNLGAAESLAVRIGGDVLNAQINADEISCWRRRAIGQIHGHKQKPFAIFAPDQIALAVFSVESLGLELAHDDGNDDPAFERQKGDTVTPFERHQPPVIGDARIFLESRAFGFVPAIGFADLGDTTDGHLSRESEIIAQLAVVEESV